MPNAQLTPEGEVIAAYGAAMVAAFQVLINCLEERDALLPGQFPDALAVYMEMVKRNEGSVSDKQRANMEATRSVKNVALEWQTVHILKAIDREYSCDSIHRGSERMCHNHLALEPEITACGGHLDGKRSRNTQE